MAGPRGARAKDVAQVAVDEATPLAALEQTMNALEVAGIVEGAEAALHLRAAGHDNHDMGTSQLQPQCLHCVL